MTTLRGTLVLPIGIAIVLGALSPLASAAPESAAPTAAARATAARAAAWTETGAALPLSVSPQAQLEYKRKCMVCHGPTGKGDGPGAAALNPKPRTFRDPTWQASVTDDQIRKATVEGGAAVGKSPLMPAHLDLKQKPEVLAGLISLIRSFKD